MGGKIRFLIKILAAWRDLKMSPLKMGMHVRHSETKEIRRQKKYRNARPRLLLVYSYDVKTKDPKVDFLHNNNKKYTIITQGRIQSPRTESVMKYMFSFVAFIRISSDAQRPNIATGGITFISGSILPSSDSTQLTFCCTQSPNYGPSEL
jgi:hypothetical protein